MTDINYLLLLTGHKSLRGAVNGINVAQLCSAAVEDNDVRFKANGINVNPAELIAYSVSSNDYDDYSAKRREFIPGTLNPLRPAKKLTDEECIVLIGSASEVGIPISSVAILDRLDQLQNAIDMIAMNNHARGVGWIWDQPTSHHGSSAASEDPQSNFKQRLLDYWDCRHPTDSTLIKCQLTGDFFLSGQVRAAHLFPKRKSASMKSACNLHHNRMWNVRNGLLLHESIERAFDEGLLCFVYNPFLKIFIVRILDIALLPIRLSPKNPDYTKTFGDLHHDGAKLILPDGKFPYHRILAMQAQEAFMRNASAMSSEDKGGIETALTLSERLQDDDWSQKDETDIDFDADPVVLVRTVNPQVELKRTIKQAKRDRRNTVVRSRSDSSSTTQSV